MIMRKEGYFGSLHMDLRLCSWNWKLGWSYWNLGVAEPKSIVWSSWRNPGWWWWSSHANIAGSLSSHASGFSQGTCLVCSREYQAAAGCSHPCCCCCLCLANQSIVCSWANNKTHGVHTTKEKKWKGKENKKKQKKNKRRITSCVACQSNSLEAASTTNNVKSELMNVCSSSWTVGRIDQLNGFLRFEEFGVKEQGLRIQTGLQVWILQKVRRRRRRRCCCWWWWIGGGACACAFHTWDNLGVVEGRERYTTTGCLVRQILRVSACHIPCHYSQTRRNTTDGFAISDFLAKKKKNSPIKDTQPKKEKKKLSR